MKGIGVAFPMTALLLMFAMPVRAEPVTVGGGWHHMTWQNGPDAWNEGGPFTYVSTDWTRLTLTDVAYCGDQFEVYNHDSLVGTTSAPTISPRFAAKDFQYCCDDSHWSTAVFLLPPGSQSLTFKTIQTAQGYAYGNAYFRVDTTAGPIPPIPNSIPAPGAIVLGTLGTGLVGRLRRRGML